MESEQLTVVRSTDASRLRRWMESVQERPVYRAVLEIGLVAVAFLLYFLVRGAVVDRDVEALRNANHVIDFERAVGIFWEPRLQEMVLHRQALISLFNFIYFWLDFPLIVAVGLWMYFFRRHEYTITRDAILLSGAISLVLYNFFPVMPPRLLPTGEFVGTIEKYNDLSYQAQSSERVCESVRGGAEPAFRLGDDHRRGDVRDDAASAAAGVRAAAAVGAAGGDRLHGEPLHRGCGGRVRGVPGGGGACDGGAAVGVSPLAAGSSVVCSW